MLKSLKEMLGGEESAELKQFIKNKKVTIEKELGYSRNECVEDDFLFTLLSNGYINEEYRYYIQKTTQKNFTIWERSYIDSVINEETPFFTAEINDAKSVIEEIDDYRWSDPSVLNNDIFTYLIQNNLYDRIGWFINAIKNYFEKYHKNDFVDQYVASIKDLGDRNKIVKSFLDELSKKLNSDISNDLKMNYLLSFFCNGSGALFCEMIENRPDDDYYIKILNDFFEKRKSVLDYTLDFAEKNASFKKKLLGMNIEVKKVSDYIDSTQKKIVDNAMFLLSRENLDYIIAQQTDIQPHFYYDYIRKNPRLKSKINGPDKVGDFVEEFLIGDNECKFGPEGIVDFLFTTSIDDVEIDRFADKIEDEYVDLTYLSKFYSDVSRLNFIIKLDSSLIHTLIQLNKIKIDFNNLVYISWSNIVDDVVLFAKKQIREQGNSLLKYGIDDLASLSLEHFYGFLLKEEKVDVALLEQESFFLINQAVDIGEFASLLLNDDKEISVDKKHIFIRLLFRRTFQNANSNNKFASIIKKEFEYFYDKFSEIRKLCEKATWILNISILLKNENKVLEENYLDRIMKKMFVEDFEGVMKVLCDQIGYFETSKIAEKLLNIECLREWLEKYGKNSLVAFVKSVKNYMTEDFEIVLKNRINSL